MFLKRNGLLIVLFALVWQVCHSNSIHDIRINEVMQSNVDYLVVDNDFPDSWVELYNTSDAPVDLKGAFIGLTTDHQAAYCIPQECIIPPKGYVVIYCDKEDRGLHTDFRLESGKGNLYFFSPNGDLIDELHHKKMPAPNVAFGRIADGSEEWQYEIEPSAGGPNNGLVSTKVLPNPVFSAIGGSYIEPISITISIPDEKLPEDTKVYITLDGSEPTSTSLSGERFTFDIAETTIIRAKLISSMALSPRSTTQSYIFHPRETKLPIISVVSDDMYFYSDGHGILIGGNNDKTTNCYQGWRRPINIEYYDSRDGHTTTFNQLSETMVAGNYSRAYPQKSLKFYAHKRWGTKRFSGRLWDDKENVTQVKSLMLRNGGTACLYGRLNDAIIQKIFGTHLSTLDWQAYKPVILYINGKYKGVYHMRERSNEDYVESNYNGLEDIEIHENPFIGSAAWGNTLFQSFYDTYMSPNVSYDEICSLMDVDNFMDSFIAEMFSTNYDYPDNNISVWRSKSLDGKWRWILKDLDYTGLRKPVSYNMFDYMFRGGTPGSDEWNDARRWESIEKAQQLYMKMMSFPEYKEVFIDRFTTYLGDFLKPSLTSAVVSEMEDEIRDELPDTYEAYSEFKDWCGRYEDFYAFDSIANPFRHYEKSVNEIIDFWEKRPLILYKQMADFFCLGQVLNLSINSRGHQIEMNGTPLRENDFAGCYYSDRVMRLSLTTPNTGWKLQIEHSDGDVDDYFFESSDIEILLKNYQKEENDMIKVVLCPIELSTHINHLKDNGKPPIRYDLNGIIIHHEKRGINIVKTEEGCSKYIHRP